MIVGLGNEKNGDKDPFVCGKSKDQDNGVQTLEHGGLYLSLNIWLMILSNKGETDLD